MTKTLVQATAFVLAALVTGATVAASNGIAAGRYVAAERVAQSSSDLTHLALQRVVVVGHRAKA